MRLNLDDAASARAQEPFCLQDLGHDRKEPCGEPSRQHTREGRSRKNFDLEVAGGSNRLTLAAVLGKGAYLGILLLCFVPLSLVAQQPSPIVKNNTRDQIASKLPDAPSASRAVEDSRTDASALRTLEISAKPLSAILRPPEASRRIADSKFWLLNAFQIAGTIADIESTVAGQKDPNTHESNLLLGSHPSRGQMYAVTLPINVGIALLSYRLKKHAPHSQMWKIPPLVFGSIHGLAAARNVFVAKE
jgi:hypothetical protein